MKITYISASIIPSSLANSVNVMKMCNALANNGNEVILVGTKGIQNTDAFNFYNINKNFEIKLSKNNKISSILRLIEGIKSSRKAEIVYTRWIVAAIILSIFTNKKIIFEHHAPFQKKVHNLFESHIMNSERIIRHIFITESLKRYYIKKYPQIINKDIIVLPDAADLVEIKNDNIEFDCIYVGSFQKGKGVEIVIEIANRLPSLKFAIVGGNEQEVKNMKELSIKDNIKWFGFLPHKETYNILSKAKIALLPNQPNIFVGESKLDIGRWTSPMKLFEYMSNKKAIIASDLSVLKEILIHGENSLLVRHDDIDEWKNAILKLISDKDLYDTISSNAYEELKQKYTWNSRAKLALEGITISEK